MAGEFKADMETIRARARSEMRKGPVTDAYGADLEQEEEHADDMLGLLECFD